MELAETGLIPRTARVEAHLYGSLALTGKSHGADRAVLLGLEGETPEGVDVDAISERVERIRTQRRLQLGGAAELDFDEARDVRYHRAEVLPAHPNGMRFRAMDAQGGTLAEKVYYSVGGGFVVNEAETASDRLALHVPEVPFPYHGGDDLLRLARESGLSVSEMTLRNEGCWRPEAGTRAGLLRVWRAMQNCVERGCHAKWAWPATMRQTGAGMSTKYKETSRGGLAVNVVEC